MSTVHEWPTDLRDEARRYACCLPLTCGNASKFPWRALLRLQRFLGRHDPAPGRLAAAGATITEVPSVEKGRLFGASDRHGVSDGLRVLRTLLAERRRASSIRRTERKLDKVARLRHGASEAAQSPVEGAKLVA